MLLWNVPNETSDGYEPGIVVRAFRNGSVNSCSGEQAGEGKAMGAMLTPAAAKHIARIVLNT